MDKKTSIIVVILIIIGIFFFTKGNEKEISEVDRSESAFVEKLPIQHSYENGIHSIYGVIGTPTPCHKIKIVSELIDEGINIDIETVETGDMCTQVITDQSFVYSFVADEDITMFPSLNGKKIDFTIINLEKGEEFDLSSFMFKG